MKCEDCGKDIKFDERSRLHFCRVCWARHGRMHPQTLKHLKIIREQKK